MAAIIYTAKRRLVSGHTAGVAYSFDVGVKVVDPITEVDRTDHKSLSGHVESWVGSVTSGSICRTVPMLETDPLCDIMWEFLTSCLGGETFNLDEWGTVAVPVNPRNFALVSKSINPVREGETRCLSFPFEVREIV